MEEIPKETVIIVHGTWAAPEPERSRWYKPFDNGPAAKGFISKLDAALQERGSPARCWAHCTQRDQLYQWSGDNSWIARTSGASALTDYVTKLRSEGWRCHIVVHSHGGNVVVEALPQIMVARGSNGLPGKIVTLGTPFIDTMSPLLNSIKRRGTFFKAISLISLVIVFSYLIVVATILRQRYDIGEIIAGYPLTSIIVDGLSLCVRGHKMFERRA
jgi:hypothetical protein